MPVEIKELVIRAVVGGEDRDRSEAADPDVDLEEIVGACVREVLTILKRSKER